MVDQDKESFYVIQCCIQMAQYQDSLLQSYQQIFIAMESVFIALAIAIMSFRQLVGENLLPVLINLAITGLMVICLWYRIVNDRAKWVDWWHRKLLEWEERIPEEYRLFTKFKQDQKPYNVNVFIPKAFTGAWLLIIALSLAMLFST